MKGQLEIYDDGIDNIQAQINKLQKNIDKLRRENDGYEKDRAATAKHLEDAQWTDKNEDEMDIRFYEGAIKANNKQIEADLAEIERLKADLKNMMNLKNPSKDR